MPRSYCVVSARFTTPSSSCCSPGWSTPCQLPEPSAAHAGGQEQQQQASAYMFMFWYPTTAEVECGYFIIDAHGCVHVMSSIVMTYIFLNHNAVGCASAPKVAHYSHRSKPPWQASPWLSRVLHGTPELLLPRGAPKTWSRGCTGGPEPSAAAECCCCCLL